MAEQAYVSNQNGVAVASAGDSFVYFIPDGQVAEFEETLLVDDDEARDWLDDHALLRCNSVGRLLAIVESACTVLDNLASGESLREMAKAIEEAGFVSDGYYSELYSGQAAEEDEA
jgi:hypothetical protein